MKRGDAGGLMDLLIDGHSCQIDAEDLASFCSTLTPWRVRGSREAFYLARWSVPGVKVQFAHQFLMPDAGMIDHINGDGLDNRRENLRPCNQFENAQNRRVSKSNKVGLKGVYEDRSRSVVKYRAQISAFGKRYRLGSFLSPTDAARAYDHAALSLHGNFAVTNGSLGLI
jgi:hypothetical protein